MRTGELSEIDQLDVSALDDVAEKMESFGEGMEQFALFDPRARDS